MARSTLPHIWIPNTSLTEYDRKGRRVRRRFFGSDGLAINDIDYAPHHGHPVPHAHDWEFYLKVSRQYDFVHVPFVTGMYSIRNDSSNMMQYRGPAIADAMRRMMTLFPLEGRPLIEKARHDVLARFEAQGGAVFPPPPLRLQ